MRCLAGRRLWWRGCGAAYLVAPAVPHALVHDEEDDLVLQQVEERVGAVAAAHQHRHHRLLEPHREVVVRVRRPHPPADAVEHFPHKLAVGAPRPPPEAALAERPVRQVGEAGEHLEDAVAVRRVVPLVVVHDRLVAGERRVDVEPERLAWPQPQRRVEHELGHLAARRVRRVVHLRPLLHLLVLPLERVRRLPHRERAELAAHRDRLDLDVLDGEDGVAGDVEHHL